MISRGEMTVVAKTGMLSEVIVIVRGPERQDECVCVMRISGEGVGGVGHVVAAAAVTNIAC